MNEQKTVLVIDDEEAIRKNIGALLEDLGWQVALAANGAEGLEEVERVRPDIVLTDLRMPVLDGYEFISRMKESHPDTPVIVVSGTGAIRDAIDAIRRGAWDYMLKPLKEPAELEVIIGRALERARLLVENRRYQAHLEELVTERTSELRKLNEQLEQRVRERTADLENTNQQLEAFSYSVSHDLRAPLRSIHSFAQLLKEGCEACLDDEGKHHLERILVVCSRMQSLIADLLILSRLNLLPLNEETVQPQTLARDVVNDLLGEATERVELVFGELPPFQGDPILVRQVFANLIGNALKYSRKRESPRIEIGSFPRNFETVYYVKDNGAGFDMKHAGKLFEVFQRLHNSEEFEGTGVGLAIVKNIIKRHGGAVWAEAEVDKGATIFFTVGKGKAAPN